MYRYCKCANFKELLFKFARFAHLQICILNCGQSRVRTYVLVREQIYSLPPLTTRPSAQKTKIRAEDWSRTSDLLITNQLLYQLSYFGKKQMIYKNLIFKTHSQRTLKISVVFYNYLIFSEGKGK